MPPLDHLHPAVVHFAIAPLVLAPAFLALALFWRSRRPGLRAAAGLLVAAGLIGSVLSLLSGQEVERFARATAELRAAAQVHEQAGQLATLLAGGLALLLLATWVVPKLLKRDPPRGVEWALRVACLALAALAAAAVLRTGHLGGILVHRLHTHASPPAAPM